MEIIPTSIPDVVIINPNVFGDGRGFFLETYQKQRYRDAGLTAEFVQDSHSGSHIGTLRGLHYQIQQAQGKLVRVIVGEVYDVAVDIRLSSPTFGKWIGVCLSAENRLQTWVPSGFAHGFYVLSEWAEVAYKATDYYAKQWERTLLWSDPQIGIDWHLIPNAPLILSQKDQNGQRLAEAELYD